MVAQYKLETDGSISMTLNIKPEGSMLEQEEQIAAAVAEVGRLATQLSLSDFDTSGSPIIVNNEKYTSRGKEKKLSVPLGRSSRLPTRVSTIKWRQNAGSPGAQCRDYRIRQHPPVCQDGKLEVQSVAVQQGFERYGDAPQSQADSKHRCCGG